MNTEKLTQLLDEIREESGLTEAEVRLMDPMRAFHSAERLHTAAQVVMSLAQIMMKEGWAKRGKLTKAQVAKWQRIFPKIDKMTGELKKLSGELEVKEGYDLDGEPMDETKYMGHGGTKMSQHLDSDQEEMFDAIMLYAENEGRFYAKKDVEGAIKWAIQEHMKYESRQMREDARVLKPLLVKELASRWSGN